MHRVDELYKIGRSSGFTKGEYGPLEQVHIYRSRDPQGNPVSVATLEHSISYPPTSPFCLLGDSGSFIFENSGGVVGLLFGASERKDTAYFTHITDLFDDIKEVTGAIEVRIAKL